jgi:transcription elongation factor Elf1
MAGKTEKKTVEVKKETEIVFKCKFCGETKPLSELVVMRHYYPQISACKKCARGTKDALPEEEKIPDEAEK